MRLLVVRPLVVRLLIVAVLLTGCGAADEVERIVKVAEEQQETPETSCPAEVQATFAEELCKLADEEPGCNVSEIYTARQAAVIFDGLVWACEHDEPEGDQ